jgi:hypothetical protein
MPIFAKAGAIIPLAVSGTWGDLDVPQFLEIHLFPQADNQFLLFEDDGGSKAVESEIVQYFNEAEWCSVLKPAEGYLALLPEVRSFTFKFRGIDCEVSCLIEKNGEAIQLPIALEKNHSTVSVGPVEVSPNDRIEIKLVPTHGKWDFSGDWQRNIFDKLTQASKIDSWVKQKLDRQYEQIKETPSLIEEHLPGMSAQQQQAFFELFTGVGLHKLAIRDGREERLILWNNFCFEDAEFRFSTLDGHQQPFTIHKQVPSFGYIAIENEKISYQDGSEARRYFDSIDAWLDCLEQSIEAVLFDRQGIIQFDFLDDLPTSFYLEIQDGKGAFCEGKASRPDAKIKASADSWLSLINGWNSTKYLIQQDQIKISGNYEVLLQLSKFKNGVIINSFLSETWQIGLTYYGGLSTTCYQAAVKWGY